ncbi:methyltransferase domain-containing protein [Pseudomonas syringae]|uniref:methyltransferase domain-containing protein n=1 Tax=Pseudomonas syringae TaxID=317 RepID=UPI001372FC1C|nr:class I SAM-dependent methyltransferase [Pseudomonas syringae]MDU8432117.1 methyltransferase domain-containing protein [Pseudomonas syringae pv. actinidifoliorum]MDU8522469.1 methyltransferase domain-containing protein [Pseudomonas syringae pv. actinidifoliorum]MDU8529127.1 methyltransferase domain-containing protein [Pseudomonas syringae pv. actinidifoliorum]NAS99052.1 SAM-dependent methyltransferase [Pseudomonas syringae pv. actinidifoliorum]NAT24648.1 SAM-dependent methyltransferase [Pse
MRTCPVCSNRFPNFYPMGRGHLEIANRLNVFHSADDFETLNIGQYSCPECLASDRDRLYALYAMHLLNNPPDKELRILDIAPAAVLSSFLRSLPKARYRSADLYSPLADDIVDIMDMHIYADESFDLIVCSHVLEHVRDDRKAMSELFRVLAKNGSAILMVPILLQATHTDEDPDEKSVDERWARFGQDDHVRLYSKNDFISRLKQSGFEIDALGSQAFGEGVFKQHGITERSVLYIGRKP